MSLSEDPYTILGIARGSDQHAIRRAYFDQVRVHPPETDPEHFKTIRGAYDRLRTPERQIQTDLFLLQPPPPVPKRRMPKFDVTVHREDVLSLAYELGWTSVQDKLKTLDHRS